MLFLINIVAAVLHNVTEPCCTLQWMMMTFLYKSLRANLIFPEEAAFTKSCGFHSLQVESRKTILDLVFHVSIHFHQKSVQHPRPEYKTVIRQPFLEYTMKVQNSYKNVEIIWIPHSVAVRKACSSEGSWLQSWVLFLLLKTYEEINVFKILSEN